MSSSPIMQYKVGLHNVGSYQVSGKPWASGSVDAATGGIVKISFPFVTNWILVKNTSPAEVKVAFSQNGLGANENFMTLTSGSILGPLELKISELHFTGTTSAVVDVMAGLTSISTDSINNNANSPISQLLLILKKEKT